jgi:Putative F0F1-ATPase subunit Ca2+/Mg2+ transporter
MSTYRNIGRYGTAGLEVVVGIVGGFFIGRALDTLWFGAHGYGTAAFVLLGVAAGFRNLFRSAKHMQQDLDREDNEAFPFEREYLELAEHASDPGVSQGAPPGDPSAIAVRGSGDARESGDDA